MHGIRILVLIQEGFQQRGGIAEVLEFCEIWGEDGGFGEITISAKRPQPDGSLNRVRPSISDALLRIGVYERPSQLVVSNHSLTGGGGVVSQDDQEILEALGLQTRKGE